MRPSHVLHTFWVGNLRLVLDVHVSSGTQHTSVHPKAAWARLLDELGDGADGRRPALVRGDSGYGVEAILVELESRGQPYLLRMRQTANVQRLVAQQFARQDWSRPACRQKPGSYRLLCGETLCVGSQAPLLQSRIRPASAAGNCAALAAHSPRCSQAWDHRAGGNSAVLRRTRKRPAQGGSNQGQRLRLLVRPMASVDEQAACGVRATAARA